MRGKGIDDAANRAHKVEVDNGTPCKAFIAESIRCIGELEF